MDRDNAAELPQTEVSGTCHVGCSVEMFDDAL